MGCRRPIGAVQVQGLVVGITPAPGTPPPRSKRIREGIDYRDLEGKESCREDDLERNSD